MKRNKDIFSYNKCLAGICVMLSNHKHRKLIGWDESFETNNFKRPDQYDFYYKCKICGYVFFNHKPTLQELNFIKNNSVINIKTKENNTKSKENNTIINTKTKENNNVNM